MRRTLPCSVTDRGRTSSSSDQKYWQSLISSVQRKRGAWPKQPDPCRLLCCHWTLYATAGKSLIERQNPVQQYNVIALRRWLLWVAPSSVSQPIASRRTRWDQVAFHSRHHASSPDPRHRILAICHPFSRSRQSRGLASLSFGTFTPMWSPIFITILEF
jgi:hypothetical protein